MLDYMTQEIMKCGEHPIVNRALISSRAHATLNHGFFVINIEMVKEYKNQLINVITDFLLDKKLSNKKLCITCGKNVGLSWQHKECNSCFKAGRFNNFDFNDEDYYL
jgi:hypothetical protein